VRHAFVSDGADMDDDSFGSQCGVETVESACSHTYSAWNALVYHL